MAANEELVEAVAQAIHGAEVGWRSALGTNTPKRIMVARAVLAVPGIADALAGCHAVTTDMPPLEVSRGWSRDEVLAAMDAGNTVERLGGFGNWYTPPRSFIWAWPDDVVAYDVRVVAPVPKTEDVPLHEVVGRKLPGHDGEILNYRGDAAGVFVCTSTRLVRVSLKADGTVTVQAEGEA